MPRASAAPAATPDLPQEARDLTLGPQQLPPGLDQAAGIWAQPVAEAK